MFAIRIYDIQLIFTVFIGSYTMAAELAAIASMGRDRIIVHLHYAQKTEKKKIGL
jgi:hypothetical protein